MSGPDDRDASAELVAAVVRGDDAALAEVRRWIRGALTPYRSRFAAEVEDLEQQVVLELLEALAAGRFERRSLLSTYVRRMVHHKCLNRLRSGRGKAWVELADNDLADREPGPFELLRRRESLELALRVVRAMPDACVELWGMIARGLDYATIGEAFGVSAGALRVRALRCREKALAERERLARAVVAGGRRPSDVTEGGVA